MGAVSWSWLDSDIASNIIGNIMRVVLDTNVLVAGLDSARGASLNQFITVAVAEKVSAMQTAAFFSDQAGKAQAQDLARFLATVKDRDPLPGDELPPASPP